MRRGRKNPVGRTSFDKPAQIHNRHTVSHMAHDMKIVSDNHDRQAKPLAKIVEEIQNLALHRYVEARRWFVGDDQPRVQSNGAGDADASCLAARQLMRKSVCKICRQTNKGQQTLRLGCQIDTGRTVYPEWLGNEVADPHARRQGSDRILEHHRHVPSQGLHGG